MLKSVISVRTFFIHFRLVLLFQLDMGDLLVELKLGGGSGGVKFKPVATVLGTSN